ncbi:MAG: hypothetical protein CMF36_09535 [Leeuwenhoekiella sp.]|nr:hypothetical protein [Leeuwenhoekiella sp.]MBA81360.1 hypothetical protein [Leeuwenhoekiella sp.]|tara:strand:+ start:4425 stop:6332 length:1908 start_codon:yes stop_codon:yes gene_type:complete
MMIRTLALFLFVTPLLAFSQNQEDFSALSVDSALSKGADSVLRFEDITLDFSDEGKLKTTIDRVVTVYNKTGMRDVRAIAGYDNNSKVTDIEAIIYDLMGNEQEKIKKRDFKDYSAVDGGTLYADNRVLVLDYTPTRYPFTIRFTAESVSETTAFVRPWMPVFTYDSGTQYSKYSIIHKPEDSLHVKATNFEGYDIEYIKTPEQSVWIARDIKPVSYEYKSPALDKRVPRVKAYFDKFYLAGVPGVGGTWEAFGKWMYDDLIKDTQQLDASVITEVQNLVKDLPDDEAKVKAVYQYLQDKVRYISVQVEIGGWKPMPAADVHRLSYGDCKALSNYMQSLLNAVGVKSYYTVLYGDPDKESLDTDVVAMQGNHVILGVQLGDEIKFLECTSQQSPFGYMGTFTDDRDVLLLTPEGGKLARTTKYNQEDNFEQIVAHIELDAEGNLQGDYTETSKGIFYSSKMSLESKDQKDLSDHYYENFSGIKSLSVSDIKLQNDRDRVMYEEHLKLNARNYASKIGDDFLAKINPFSWSNEMIPPRYTDRKSDFVILRGHIRQHEITFKIPEGYKLGAIAEPVALEEDFASYKTEIHVEGDTVNYKRIFKLNEGSYAVDAYEAYRDFYKNVVREDNQKLFIEKL